MKELIGYDRERAMQKAGEIYNVVKEIIKISKSDNIPTYQAADKLAEDIIARG